MKYYKEQFDKDFSLFLRLRHQELVSRGKIVLIFCGRKDENVYNGDLNKLFGLLSRSLQSLVSKVNTSENYIIGLNFFPNETL